MRKQLLLYGFLLLNCSSYCQKTKVDSLMSSIETLTGESKVRAMNELTLLLLPTNVELAETLAFKSIKSAKTLENKKLLAQSLDRLGKVYQQQNNPDAALKYYQNSLAISTRYNDNIGVAQAKTNIGLLLQQISEHDAAIEMLHEALFVWQVLRDSANISRTTTVLGSIYHLKKLKNDALQPPNDSDDAKIAQLSSVNKRNRYERALLFFLVGLAGIMSALAYISLLKKRKDAQVLEAQNKAILSQKTEMDSLVREMELSNVSLEMLNKKLVEEIAERENIERSSFARDRFLAIMSHEMRTPLNVITGLTHLLLENNTRPDQTEQLRTLQFASNELVVFINDVLDFSKIEAGKLDLQYREFDLETVATTVFNNFILKADAKGLLLHSSFDDQIPKNLVGDEARVFQILTNLLNCCLETTAEGLIRAQIALVEQNNREAVVKMVIESADGGFELKMLSGHYDALSEEDVSFENLDGSQLSLAITKRLIELQHGRFLMENVFGEATRFTVLLPFKVAFSKIDHKTQLDISDHSHLRGSQILLVEDNKINQLVVAKMLRRYGMTVLTADNGLEAIELLYKQDFDLVLMDIQMPEMDGYRATAEIRNMESPTKSTVPIIALTSSAFLTEKEKAVLFGMNDHVGKPFSPDELLEKISACLVIDEKE